jgi:uncharacterized membrane protein (UPF0182 family)
MAETVKKPKKKNVNRIIRTVFIIALLVILSILALGDFITDFIWFREVGYTEVFLKELFTKLELGLPIFLGVTLLAVALLNALKSGFLKKNQLVLGDKSVKKRVRIISIVLSATFSLLLTVMIVSDLWFQILQFINSTDFNVADPLFHKDVSFYIFKLDFLRGLASGATIIIVALAIMIGLFYVLLLGFARSEGSSAAAEEAEAEAEVFRNAEEARAAAENEQSGQNGQGPKTYSGIDDILSEFMAKNRQSGPRRDPNEFRTKGRALLNVAGREIIFLAILFFLSIAANFYLSQFNLLYGGTGTAYGAGFTDINVTLNVYRAMIIFSLAAAVCMAIAIRKKSIKLGLIFPVLMIIVSLAGTGIAGAVQSYIVAPDELNKESKYINNNIQYTRLAYNLQNIKVEDYAVKGDIDRLDVLDNMETFSNIRINDFEPTNQFYNQTQSIRSYYQFNDVDVDRYYINGEYTQVFLSAREINQQYEDSWLIRHLKYTHGYGITLSRVDRITSSGQPEMLIGSIPPVSDVPEIVIQRPEIYYGESTNDYVITNTGEPEFDFPSGESNQYCQYQGTGGIKLNMLNRILFAIKERTLKILISTNINGDSRILINRNIVNRVKKIAPFLSINDDPYVVVEDGKVYWIIDAFTQSAYYPYSEPYSASTNVNYIRNSVKIVVDAYNGDTNFYICDEEDPLVRTLAKIYPSLFKKLDEMPQFLKAHLQYPNNLFNIQAYVFTKYHMTDVAVFYQSEDQWSISNESYGQATKQMTPNYFIMKLPGESEGEFVSAIPYTPNGKSNMTGILMARQDGDNYGQLVLYRMPKDRTIYGPMQIEAQINQDAEISKEFALWNNSGSSYLRGNLFVIPVEDSLLYVEPVYLTATSTSLPEVKRVVMFYGDKVAYEPTLAECLDVLFGSGAGDPLKTAYPVVTGKQMVEDIKSGKLDLDMPSQGGQGADPSQQGSQGGSQEGQGSQELSTDDVKGLITQLTELLEKLNALLPSPEPEEAPSDAAIETSPAAID